MQPLAVRSLGITFQLCNLPPDNETDEGTPVNFKPILMLAVLPCAACSSIIEGTSQQIQVVTNPAGASCTFMREGQPIGTVNPTPGSVLIKKDKHDITVLCDKQGFQQATYLNHSGAAGATFGNIIAGGGIGWAVDSASGADNKYDGVVNMSLVPAAGAAPAPAAAPAGKPVASAGGKPTS